MSQESDITSIMMDALEEAVSWHTVAIVGGTEAGPGTGIGTGVAV